MYEYPHLGRRHISGTHVYSASLLSKLASLWMIKILILILILSSSLDVRLENRASSRAVKMKRISAASLSFPYQN